jgi:hypothetical protein
MAKVAKDCKELIESSFTEPLHDEEWHFLPGQGGRRPGSHDKLGHTFIADLYSDWIKHGVEAIKNVRDNKPEAYLRVVASLLPKQLEIKENVFDGLDDEQLAAIVAYVNNAIGAAQEDEGRADPTSH